MDTGMMISASKRPRNRRNGKVTLNAENQNRRPSIGVGCWTGGTSWRSPEESRARQIPARHLGCGHNEIMKRAFLDHIGVIIIAVALVSRLMSLRCAGSLVTTVAPRDVPRCWSEWRRWTLINANINASAVTSCLAIRKAVS